MVSNENQFVAHETENYEKKIKSGTNTETVEPVSVPKRPFSNIPIPCQPIPRLRTWAGGGVALASRDAALYAPVDCHNFEFQ